MDPTASTGADSGLTIAHTAGDPAIRSSEHPPTLTESNTDFAQQPAAVSVLTTIPMRILVLVSQTLERSAPYARARGRCPEFRVVPECRYQAHSRSVPCPERCPHHYCRRELPPNPTSRVQ